MPSGFRYPRVPLGAPVRFFHSQRKLTIPESSGGGADGSIMTFRDIETQYPANGGIDDIVNAQAQFLSQFGGVISPGDLCVSSFTRHPRMADIFLIVSNSQVPLASAIVPVPPGYNFSSAVPMQLRPLRIILFPRHSTLLIPFWRASPMLGSTLTKLLPFWPRQFVSYPAGRLADGYCFRHSIAASKHIDPSAPDAPFDSTPGMFDTQFFVEVQLRGANDPGAIRHKGQADSALEGEIRLQSDAELARGKCLPLPYQSKASDGLSVSI